MKIDNEDELFVSMEIQIWNNKNSNGMFLYDNNSANGFKKVYFTFNKKENACILVKTKDNYIQIMKTLKDLLENEGNEMLFNIRKNLKNNNYIVISPIKIFDYYNFISDYNNYLNGKIWFSVKSHSYLGGNTLNYNLNENDIIRFGRKKYNIFKIHFANDNKKENIINEDFYKNNNISYISIINKKSKSIFNININRYKIQKESKNINKIYISLYKDTGKESESQNIGKNGKNNNYQNSLEKVSIQCHSCNIQNETGNESNNDSDIENENENDKCWLCLNSNCNKDNPLICLCNCHNFIHYECVKVLLNSKIIVTENLKKTVTTYTCLKFNCERCLKPYQLRFRIPEIDRTYELIDLNLPEKRDYICLESLNYIKDNNIKIVHIVQLIDDEINIGRKNSNDIIDNDLSVSREHAILKYNKYNQSLFLENKNGRYGTLVLVRGSIKVSKEKTYFQILNTHISMELTNKKKFG